MSTKRKRDQNDSTIPSKKSRAAATTDETVAKATPEAAKSPTVAKSKGQLRQEKSERRSNKQKKPKKHEKKEKREVQLPPSTHGANTTSDAESAPKTAEAEGEAPAQEHISLDKSSKKKPSKKAKTSATEPQPQPQTASPEKASKSTPARFIVFIGNLPFDATVSQLTAHFSKLSPTAVRLSTDKKTGKGKGFAFLEFDAFDKMKTCLKLYHHSIFDPKCKDGRGENNRDEDAEGQEDNGGVEKSDKRNKGRRINVELTAGGGGKKSKERLARIKNKNEKLEEERERTRAKQRSEQQGKDRKQPETISGANSTAVADNGAIHPSRLSRMRF